MNKYIYYENKFYNICHCRDIAFHINPCSNQVYIQMEYGQNNYSHLIYLPTSDIDRVIRDFDKFLEQDDWKVFYLDDEAISEYE